MYLCPKTKTAPDFPLMLSVDFLIITTMKSVITNNQKSYKYDKILQPFE